MVALLSHSRSKPARFRDIARRRLPTPGTLVINRISELHRRLIDPASDHEAAMAAKRSLLRLLSDPMTLPVITTPPMEMPITAASHVPEPVEPNQVCRTCDRPLPRRSPRKNERVSRRTRKSSTRTNGDSFAQHQAEVSTPALRASKRANNRFRRAISLS